MSAALAPLRLAHNGRSINKSHASRLVDGLLETAAEDLTSPRASSYDRAFAHGLYIAAQRLAAAAVGSWGDVFLQWPSFSEWREQLVAAHGAR